MNAETVAEIVEPRDIDHDPDGAVVLPALLSLLVPGLGQAWLGQWSRGIRIFGASATLCFGLGIANVIVAYDAYSLAKKRREGYLRRSASSKSLLVFSLLWAGAMAAVDGVVSTLLDIAGSSVSMLLISRLVALPLMVVSHLGGGEGIRWS